MRIITLGAHSAFGVGDYIEGVRYEDAVKLLKDYHKLISKKRAVVSIERFLESRKIHTEKIYKPKWQSNFVLEFNENKGSKRDDEVYRLVFDFGSDYRHSLAGAGLKLTDIDGYYVSHPHNDHIGGVEYIALSSFFNPFFFKGKSDWLTVDGKMMPISQMVSEREEMAIHSRIPGEFKPDLYGHVDVINSLWESARPGLNTVQGVLSGELKLDLYFNVIHIKADVPLIMADGDRSWRIYIVPTTHVLAGYGKFMPSYGLLLKSSDGKQIFMPSDTQFMNPKTVKDFYETSDVIYQDCETGPRSDVHPHIEDLRYNSMMTKQLKEKCYLYHYSVYPEVDQGEFKGILKAGDVHEY